MNMESEYYPKKIKKESESLESTGVKIPRDYIIYVEVDMMNVMKWKKSIKIVPAIIMSIGLLFADFAGISTYANSMEQIGEAAEMPVLKSAYVDLSNLNFSVSDIRDTSRVKTFNGGDGKQAVIIFGSANCLNTMSALASITKIADKADLSDLNIYMFEIKKEVSEDTLISKTEHITDKVTIDHVYANDDYIELYASCFRNTIDGRYTMPLIIYKGTDGIVYEYTTSSQGTSVDTILSNIAKGGLVIEIPTVTLDIEGEVMYSQAYKVLELLNAEREAEGLEPLIMDQDLLDAAMLRAVECAVYYSHTRPNGGKCFTVSDKVHGENIALGFLSAEAVMDAWMNSSGHRKNILNESYKSIGVGCFFNGRGYSWVQCLGRDLATKVDVQSDATKSYTIDAQNENLFIALQSDSFTLDIGNKVQLSTYAINIVTTSGYKTDIKPDSYKWSSDSDAVSVDENGVITAMKAGEAVITGVNKGDASNTLHAQVVVNSISVTDIFTDIRNSQWWVNAVQYSYDNNIMSGKGNRFEPAVALKREEFAQVLYNHSGKPDVSIENKFPDVKDTWYKKAVLWTNENNIANGYKTGEFGISDNITRQDLALMLYKYAVLKGYDLTATDGLIQQYADSAKVSNYAQNAMNWAITQGIMSGKGNKGEDISTFKLDPTGTATRAECASMMMKLLEKNK